MSGSECVCVCGSSIVLEGIVIFLRLASASRTSEEGGISRGDGMGMWMWMTLHL